jgi:hypothetical protein
MVIPWGTLPRTETKQTWDRHLTILQDDENGAKAGLTNAAARN